MSDFEKKVLKKRSVWFHVIVTYFTIGIWAIIYFYTKSKYSQRSNQQNDKLNINNTTKENEKEQMEIKKESNRTPIKEFTFNVAGVTFENRQDIFKKIIKNGIENGYIEPYNNMTNNEIKEAYIDVYESENVSVTYLTLNPTKYDNKDAIEVHIKAFDENTEYMIGYVPKDQIKDAFDFMETFNANPNYELDIKTCILGGKYKTVEYDEEKDKDVVIIKESNYGLKVDFTIYDK